MQNLRDLVNKVRERARERLNQQTPATQTNRNMPRERREKPPKPVQRKRALSASSPNSKDQRVLQSAGLFSKLPLEIREKIYAELFGADTIWIILRDKKLLGLRGHPKNRVNALPLLQSCWWIYCEAINLLYSTPEFAFNSMSTFLTFCASILPVRFQHLRSITLNLRQGVARPVSEDSPERVRPGPPIYVLKLSPGTTQSRPRFDRLNYNFFDAYRGTLYNAEILFTPDRYCLLPNFMWDAVSSALRKMTKVQEVVVTLKDVPRQVDVWVEHGYEHSGQVDARDLKQSLESVGRDKTWKEEGRKKRKDASIVLENIWHSGGDVYTRGHWIRDIDGDEKVDWIEVGRAAEPYKFDLEAMHHTG